MGWTTKRSQSQKSINAGVGLFIAIVVAASMFLVSSAKAKDKPEDFTHVYRHTYDEVFQAAQDAIERMGYFITATDKDKGTITGNGTEQCQQFSKRIDFTLTIEPTKTDGETNLTVAAKRKGLEGALACPWTKKFSTGFLAEVQKVLATYH